MWIVDNLIVNPQAAGDLGMFLGKFGAQLAFIRQLGAEFAKEHPKIAGRLGINDEIIEDPHVSRLIESFAYLTARIQHKLDDDIPELSDAMLSVLFPHYLNPIPSMSIVQFIPDKEQLESTYTIPQGNLFPPGTAGTRPEVFTKGTRNSFRISVDQKSGFLYWGDVGPDAGSPSETFGPAGFDEINQARGPGYFGWPYFIADNKAYTDWDYATGAGRGPFEVNKPVNDSPNNTGIKELPAPQKAFIYYPASPSTRFPAVNKGGGRTAMAGPVYHFDENLKSPHKLPKKYDNHLFIYEWSRNWIVAVKLDEKGDIVRQGPKLEMEQFCGNMKFRRPMDLELGPDGCLYLAETGTAWGDNRDMQISRIEYHGE